MAGEQYNVRMSLSTWAATSEDAQAQIDATLAALPDDDARANARTTIEFIADGKPEPPEPLEAPAEEPAEEPS